jgi:prepilin-type N-terminal cleavage/methylation domain-containing protein
MRRSALRRSALRRDAGVTLMEVLIAVSLLSLLSVGMLFAIRIGLSTFGKTNDKLMYNRRVAGAQRILEQELQSLIPVVSPCGTSGLKFGFFQGEESAMRLVSSFSLQGAWRGQPQILELSVVPVENGPGVRLIVNEILYTGPASAARFCVGPFDGGLNFIPINSGPTSFVLADNLEYCRFSYLGVAEKRTDPGVWRPLWKQKGWPYGIRVEMAPLDLNPSRLQPISVTVPIYMHRSADLKYED